MSDAEYLLLFMELELSMLREFHALMGRRARLIAAGCELPLAREWLGVIEDRLLVFAAFRPTAWWAPLLPDVK